MWYVGDLNHSIFMAGTQADKDETCFDSEAVNISTTGQTFAVDVTCRTFSVVTGAR